MAQTAPHAREGGGVWPPLLLSRRAVCVCVCVRVFEAHCGSACAYALHPAPCTSCCWSLRARDRAWRRSALSATL